MFHKYNEFDLPDIIYDYDYVPYYDLKYKNDNDRIKKLSEEELVKLVKEIKKDFLRLTINLSKKYINDRQLSQIVRAISKCNSKIVRLYLSESLIEDEFIEKLLFLIQEPKLFSVDLSYNKIGEKKAKYFLNALKDNISLIRLNLHHNSIGQNILFEFQKLVNRNIQIQKECQRFEYYIAVAIFSRIANIPEGITYLILDCCNEALNFESRSYVKKNLYPKAIKIANKMILKELNEIKKNFLIQEQNDIIHKLKHIQTKHDVLNFESSLHSLQHPIVKEERNPTLLFYNKESCRYNNPSLTLSNTNKKYLLNEDTREKSNCCTMF